MAKKKQEGEVFDLDAYLGKPKNRVERVGIELEGGWKKVPAGVKVQRDGSVFKWAGDEGALARTEYPGFQFGEISFGPVMPVRIKTMLEKYFPEKIDKTCGLHVHMSFGRLFHYNILVDSPAYQETMAAYLEKWAKDEKLPEDHHIWGRLKGQSIYCQKKFWPMAQITFQGKDHNQERYGHRYTMIHYCWNRFETVECRLLPMFETVDQCYRAIKQVLDVTNAYLVVGEKSKVKEFGKITAAEDSGTKIKLELKKGEIYEEYYE